ncbi:hypothetical protein Tco_1045624 [Tanacetum coccineum]|uniref:Gag-Pol polyprotein n=1 Tax=Tanacetum coccineum TaxID=301880 RepID=A0ABQ5GUC4_9ASTR
MIRIRLHTRIKPDLPKRRPKDTPHNGRTGHSNTTLETETIRVVRPLFQTQNIVGTEVSSVRTSFGNPSQSIRTRCQLETDGEMCMFALIVSRTKPKNIKEAMADSTWIEAMQKETFTIEID